MKKVISMLLIAMFLVSIVVPDTAHAAVKLSKKKATLEVDATLALKVSGTTETITWTSSKKSVAMVSSKGKVTAKAEGKATITATAKSKKYTCVVTVVDNNKEAEAKKSNLPKITTAKELESYLQKNYDSLKTDMGTVTCKFDVISNTSKKLFGYDYDIWVEWDGISPYDVEYSSSYTTSQKNNTKKALREFQEAIYKVASEAFPSSKLEGKFLHSWYEYPTIQVGYHSIQFLTWRNYEKSNDVYAYDTSELSKFQWVTMYDDYDFTK